MVGEDPGLPPLGGEAHDVEPLLEIETQPRPPLLAVPPLHDSLAVADVPDAAAELSVGVRDPLNDITRVLGDGDPFASADVDADEIEDPARAHVLHDKDVPRIRDEDAMDRGPRSADGREVDRWLARLLRVGRVHVLILVAVAPARRARGGYRWPSGTFEGFASRECR